MAELGYLGLKYPEEHGGEGGDYVHEAVLTEELPRAGSGGLSAGIGAHIGIATPPIWTFGTEEQKRRWLAPAIRGEKIAAPGITEPEAGSDIAGPSRGSSRSSAGTPRTPPSTRSTTCSCRRRTCSARRTAAST